MRELPKHFAPFSAIEVREAYPYGSEVTLTKAFLLAESGIFMPDLSFAPVLTWRVVDHYYEIGSRKTRYCGTVVITGYDGWKKLARNIKRVPITTYGQLPDKVNTPEAVGALIAPQLRDHERFKKCAAMILTDWNGAYYNEIARFEKPMKEIRLQASDVIAGDFF